MSLLLLFRGHDSGGPPPVGPTLDNLGVSGNPTPGRSVTGNDQSGTSLAASLLAWYKLNGDLLDSSGDGYHWDNGTPFGYTTGKFGQALLTDSGAGVGSVVYRTAAFVSSGPMSIAMWVYPEADQASNNGWLWTQGQSTSTLEQYVAVYKTFNLFEAGMRSGGGQLQWDPGETVIGKWWHVALTFDGVGLGAGTQRLYVNGVERASATVTPGYVVAAVTVNRSTLGGAWFANPDNPTDASRIDNVMIWSRDIGATGVVAAMLASPLQGPANRGVTGAASKNSSVTGRRPNA